VTRTTKAALLLSSFILCASAIFATNRLRERTPAPAPRDLYSVVNDQLSAFRADDFRSAYRYAASRVQQKFTPEQFETMIRANYPEMARTGRVEFGSIQVRDASASVQAFSSHRMDRCGRFSFRSCPKRIPGGSEASKKWACPRFRAGYGEPTRNRSRPCPSWLQS